MREDHEKRLRHLVDPLMYNKDAFYHAQVECFRQWLIAMEMAMEDEGVSDGVAHRVINRVIYGHPNSGDAYHRQEFYAREVERLMTELPSPKKWMKEVGRA